MGIEKEEKLCPKCGSPYSYIEEHKLEITFITMQFITQKQRAKERKSIAT